MVQRGRRRDVLRRAMALLVSGALTMQGLPVVAMAEAEAGSPGVLETPSEGVPAAGVTADAAAVSDAEAEGVTAEPAPVGATDDDPATLEPEPDAMAVPAEDDLAALREDAVRVADELRAATSGDDEAALVEAALARFEGVDLLDAASVEAGTAIATADALAGRPTTPDGAARALALVLDALEMSTRKVVGSRVGEDEPPAWLLVRVGDGWYHVDLRAFLSDVDHELRASISQESDLEPMDDGDVREAARQRWLLVSDETIAATDEAHASWGPADDVQGSDLPSAEGDYAWQEAEGRDETDAPLPAVSPDTDDPVSDEPAGGEPAGEEPAGEELAGEDSAPLPEETPDTEDPAGEDPASEEPAGEEPAREDSAGEEPAGEEPASLPEASPDTDDPADEESANEEPAPLPEGSSETIDPAGGEPAPLPEETPKTDDMASEDPSGEEPAREDSAGEEPASLAEESPETVDPAGKGLAGEAPAGEEPAPLPEGSPDTDDLAGKDTVVEEPAPLPEASADTDDPVSGDPASDEPANDEPAPLPEAQLAEEAQNGATETTNVDELPDTAPEEPLTTEADDEVELATASDPVTSEDWTYETYYEYDENNNLYPVYVVTGYQGSATKITIPSTIDGKAMYGVADFNLGSATEVTISSGIEYLYSGAFENATQLMKITFASGSKVRRIGQRTFRNSSISQIDLPDSVEEVGIDAFANCPNLTRVHLSANLAPMFYEESCYYSTYDNEHRYIPYYYDPAGGSPNVTWDVSSSCKNYKVVNGALYSKDGSVLYRYPVGESSVTIPTGVTHVAAYAFMGHRATLTSVSLPSTLESIGSYAFAFTGLTRLTCPSSLTMICTGAFHGCESLGEVRLDAALGDMSLGGHDQFRGCTSLASVTIPEGILGIPWQCFQGCTSLASVSLPSSVQKVRPYAFAECRSLALVSGCAGLRSIDAYAFGRTAISSFPFGDQLVFVSSTAFYQCSNYADPAYPSYLSKDSNGDRWSAEDEYVVSGTESYTMAQEVLNLVNKERAAQGLGALVMDATLQKAAMLRAAETSLNFDHTRPIGADCFSACDAMAAENIAAGSSTAQAVMNQWMNSSGHRANILDSSMKCVGIGCIQVGGIYYWTQCFGRGTGSGTAAGSGTCSASHRIDVMYHAIELDGSGFNLNERLGDSMELVVGKTKTLTGCVMNQGWSRVYCPLDPATFTWTSSKPSVATVSAAGVVTGKAAGTTTITATTKGGKTWEIAVSVRAPIAISKATVTAIPDQGYTGRAIQPSVKVTYQGKDLVQGTDYELTFKNNVELGTATVTIKGIGYYTGSRNVTFKIKRSIREGRSYGYINPYYTGSPATMPVWVYARDGSELVEGTDYKLSFTEAVNAGDTLFATVTGVGEFTGTINIEANVQKRQMSLWWSGSKTNMIVVADVKDQVYTGKAVKPKPKVTFNGITLKEGSDFTYEYEDNVRLGTGYVIIRAVEGGNFVGYVTKTFEIAKAASTIKLAAQTKTYTGKAITYTGKVTKTGSTGKVTYRYYSDSACTKAVAAANVKNAGTYYVKATVAADANYAEKTSAAAKLTVTKAASTVKLAAQTRTYAGKALAYTGKVTRSGSAGKVTYKYYSDAKCTKEVKAANVKAAKTYYVKATVAADANHKAATSAAAKFTVAKAASTIKLAAQTKTYAGKALAYTGKVTRSGSTGKVTYRYYSDAKCTKEVKAANVKAAKTYYVKGTVAADANHKAATSAAAKLTIAKAANPVTAKAAAKTASLKTLKSKSVTVAPLAVTKAQGKVTYAKSSGSSALTVNKTTGKVTVKKGTKKGTYTAKVKVTAAGSANYKSGSKTVTVKVTVK